MKIQDLCETTKPNTIIEKFKTTINDDFIDDPLSGALEDTAIDYVENTYKEIKHGLGLK